MYNSSIIIYIYLSIYYIVTGLGRGTRPEVSRRGGRDRVRRCRDRVRAAEWRRGWQRLITSSAKQIATAAGTKRTAINAPQAVLLLSAAVFVRETRRRRTDDG